MEEITREVEELVCGKRETREDRLKKQILSKFEVKNLKEICKFYRIGEPPLAWIDQVLTGGTRKEYYIKWIMERLTLNQITSFCKRHGIEIGDIVGGVPKPKTAEKMHVKVQKFEVGKPTETEKAQATEFDSILDCIEKEFEPENVRDEEELRIQLLQFLKARFPDKKPEKGVPTRRGKVDILIAGRYAIELKIADNKGKLRNLVGQLRDYKKEYNEVGVVLLDVNRVSSSDIDEYKREYQKDGVRTIVLKGGFRHKSPKKRRVIVEG
ncbi:MAG: hypothetical protein QW356_05030 [Candidatus Hadarchaeales archaeon]